MIGGEGQQKLARARLLLIGCGALGSVIAEQLVRGGVGFLRIIDRDLVELTNLQRQTLFDEKDAAENMPKALAAQRRLRSMNSSVRIEPVVVDVANDNIQAILRDEVGLPDVILDGTDNAETRYLINDVAVKSGVPWVYGACVGSDGRAMAIVPGTTPCLRCIFPDPPAAGELPTCDTAGVLAPVAAMVASIQVIEALKLLLGQTASGLIRLDGWKTEVHRADVTDARRPDCPSCGLHRFDFLDAPPSPNAARLCGRNAVQIRPCGPSNVSFPSLAERLKRSLDVQPSAHVLRCRLPEDRDIELSIFPDGRAIVHGTSDISRARSLYARFVGA